MNIADLIGVKLGNYRIERLLGRGRMGIVYLARDEALLRPTALKLLSWSMPERPGLNPEAWFLAEARHVARINHPHVVQIYGVAKHGPHCYIAMEYVAGAAADRWLAEKGPFSPIRAGEILVQAAEALQAAHDAGVVHRDVKPGNLLITAEGTAKLGDFGMALSLTAQAPHDAVRAGTPYYTAPEIWRGQSASPASDIYALGATFFYLLTGRPPLEATNLDQLIVAHQEGAVPDVKLLLGDAPAACNELIQLCMAKSAKDRFPSASALAREVRSKLLQRFVSIPIPPPSARAPRPPSASSNAPPDSRARPAVGQKSNRRPPLASLRLALLTAFREEDLDAVLLSGPPGSGKTTVARQLSLDCAELSQLVCWLDVDAQQPLQGQILRAFGVTAPPLAGGAMDSLLSHLGREARTQSVPAVLVIDRISASLQQWAEIAQLLQLAATSKAFRVLLVNPSEVAPQWAEHRLNPGSVRLRHLVIPLLTPMQTMTHLNEWLATVQPPGARRLLITPDAALLVAYRSGGNLGLIHGIARGMLKVAAHERSSVLGSWAAWVAPTDGSPLPPSAGRQPRDWPTPEVLELLDSQRRAVGIPPRGTWSGRALASSDLK